MRVAAPYAAEPWVSVEEAAAYLGVKKLSVYRWIENRGLPARRVGRLWKLKMSEVDAWVQANGRDTRDASVPGASPPNPAGGQKRELPKERPTILVIDDEEGIRENIGDFLTDKGYQVLLARDGAEALDFLSGSVRPSLIILDLTMPKMDGWKFRELQNRDPNLAAIPVVVVTAASTAKLDGVTAVLRKPLRLSLLAKAVEDLIVEGER